MPTGVAPASPQRRRDHQRRGRLRVEAEHVQQPEHPLGDGAVGQRPAGSVGRAPPRGAPAGPARGAAASSSYAAVGSTSRSTETPRRPGAARAARPGTSAAQQCATGVAPDSVDRGEHPLQRRGTRAAGRPTGAGRSRRRSAPAAGQHGGQRRLVDLHEQVGARGPGGARRRRGRAGPRRAPGPARGGRRGRRAPGRRAAARRSRPASTARRPGP